MCIMDLTILIFFFNPSVDNEYFKKKKERKNIYIEKIFKKKKPLKIHARLYLFIYSRR